MNIKIKEYLEKEPKYDEEDDILESEEWVVGGRWVSATDDGEIEEQSPVKFEEFFKILDLFFEEELSDIKKWNIFNESKDLGYITIYEFSEDSLSYYGGWKNNNKYRIQIKPFLEYLKNSNLKLINKFLNKPNSNISLFIEDLVEYFVEESFKNFLFEKYLKSPNKTNFNRFFYPIETPFNFQIENFDSTINYLYEISESNRNHTFKGLEINTNLSIKSDLLVMLNKMVNLFPSKIISFSFVYDKEVESFDIETFKENFLMEIKYQIISNINFEESIKNIKKVLLKEFPLFLQ